MFSCGELTEMADGASLENWSVRKGTKGSNPLLASIVE